MSTMTHYAKTTDTQAMNVQMVPYIVGGTLEMYYWKVTSTNGQDFRYVVHSAQEAREDALKYPHHAQCLIAIAEYIEKYEPNMIQKGLKRR